MKRIYIIVMLLVYSNTQIRAEISGEQKSKYQLSIENKTKEPIVVIINKTSMRFNPLSKQELMSVHINAKEKKRIPFYCDNRNNTSCHLYIWNNKDALINNFKVIELKKTIKASTETMQKDFYDRSRGMKEHLISIKPQPNAYVEIQKPEKNLKFVWNQKGLFLKKPIVNKTPKEFRSNILTYIYDKKKEKFKVIN